MRLLDRLFSRESQVASGEVVEGYCFRCRAMREFNNAAEVRMGNGRLSTRGACAVCGGGMSKIVKG